MVRQIAHVPKKISYSFKFNILGLRDIKPFIMLHIKKDYIKFDMNRLNVSGEKQDNFSPKMIQPKNKVSNSTIS